MKIKDLVDFIESFAPLSNQESYDNSGLIIGTYDNVIKGVLICLDITDEVIDECISLGYNVILSHHPVIFKGVKKINGANQTERAIIKAIKYDINIYAAHTSLDNAFRDGVSAAIAQRLDLQISDVLDSPVNSLSGNEIFFGSGVFALTNTQIKTEEFLEKIKDSLNLEVIRHTKIINDKIEKVGICGGSGAFLLNKAIEKKCDIYISSDFKYHNFFEADGRIIIADIGHYESEILSTNLLFDKISKNYSNFAVRLTSVITNPIKYL